MKKCLILATAVLLAVPVLALPFLTQQPSPLTNSVSPGAALTNKIIATSTNPPVSYQWRLNGADIPGAIGNVLIISNVNLADDGSYTALASDPSGSVESKAWGVQVERRPNPFRARRYAGIPLP